MSVEVIEWNEKSRKSQGKILNISQTIPKEKFISFFHYKGKSFFNSNLNNEIFSYCSTLIPFYFFISLQKKSKTKRLEDNRGWKSFARKTSEQTRFYVLFPCGPEESKLTETNSSPLLLPSLLSFTWCFPSDENICINTREIRRRKKKEALASSLNERKEVRISGFNWLIRRKERQICN